MMPQISVYASLVLLLSTFFLQSVQTGPVTVRVMRDSNNDVSNLWLHLSVRVSGGGAWLRGRGCLRNDTCASGGNGIYNAVHIGGRQACVNGPACQGALFHAVVADSDQILKLDLSRNKVGNVLTINGSCTDDEYRLEVSNGHQYHTFQYSQLSSTSTSTYQCRQRETITFPLTTTSTTTSTTTPTTAPTFTPTTTTTQRSVSANSNSIFTRGAACRNTAQDDQNMLVKVIPAAVIGALVLIVITAVITTIVVRRRLKNPYSKETQHTVQLTSHPTYENQPLGTVDYENQPPLSTTPASSTYMNHHAKGARAARHQTSERGVRASESGSVYTELDEVLNDSHEYTTPTTS